MKRKLHDTNYFYFSNGKVAKDVKEMINILKGVSEQEFSLHTSKEKNDIANWIRHVYDRPDLADEIEKKPTKKAIMKILKKAIAKHEKHEKKAKKELQKMILDYHKSTGKAPKHREKTEILKKPAKNNDESEERIFNADIEKGMEDFKAENVRKSLSTEFAFGLIIGFALGLIIASVLRSAGL